MPVSKTCGADSFCHEFGASWSQIEDGGRLVEPTCQLSFVVRDHGYRYLRMFKHCSFVVSAERTIVQLGVGDGKMSAILKQLNASRCDNVDTSVLTKEGGDTAMTWVSERMRGHGF